MAKIRIADILRTLETGVHPLNKRQLDRLSDLNETDFSLLKKGMETLPLDKLVFFFKSLSDYLFEELMVDYSRIGMWGLDHASDLVRKYSVMLLMYNEDESAHRRLLELAETDPSEDVRADAMMFLGGCLYHFVVEDQDPFRIVEDVKACLERIYAEAPSQLSLFAMRQLAILGGDTVDERIGKALASRDSYAIIMALEAIQRALTESWNTEVLGLVNHPDDDVAIIALQTCSVLRLRRALPALYQKLSQFERYSEENLKILIQAFVEFGDLSSVDVLELLAEVVEEDSLELTEMIDDALEEIYMESSLDLNDEEEIPDEEENDFEEEPSDFFADEYDEDDSIHDLMLNELIEREKDRCIEILEEKLPRDFDDFDDDDDECGCGDECCDHEHHHHHEEAEGDWDLSQMRIIESLEDYENAAEIDDEDNEDSSDYKEEENGVDE